MPRVSQLRSGITVTRSPFLTDFTPLPVSTTSPQNSCPGTQGKEVKGDAEGESFANMRLMSLPHRPQSLVFIFTHSGPGSTGSGISISFTVEKGPL